MCFGQGYTVLSSREENGSYESVLFSLIFLMNQKNTVWLSTAQHPKNVIYKQVLFSESTESNFEAIFLFIIKGDLFNSMTQQE